MWSILGVVVFALFWFKFVPFGHICYIHNFLGENDFISNLTPKERIVEEPGQIKMIGEPVYFTLRTPRPFKTATINFKYKYSGNKPEVMELGVLADNINWRYKLKPVENKIIDQLSLTWDKLKNDGSILLQKKPQYNCLQEFLNNPPPQEEIALYNYNWDKNYFLPDYTPDSTRTVINTPLQGSFQFYTYIKDEILDFKFNFWDINKNNQKDDFKINLYYKSKLISSKNISGDEISKANEEINLLPESGFDIQGLVEGSYKVEIRANNDIITERISSGQQKISFLNNLYLAKPDILGKDQQSIYPLRIYTDSSQLQAKTIYPSGLQSVAINGEEGSVLKIEETYKKFSQGIGNDSEESVDISINKPGIMLGGDSVFSFSQKALFNPELSKLNSKRVLDKGIKYVLANYQTSSREEDWKKKQIKFDLNSAYSEDGKYEFLISAPGLEKNDADGYIVIDEISVDLEGETAPEILKRKLIKSK